MQSDPTAADAGHKPSAEPRYTPRAKRVIELSVDEARTLSHNYIGTEHLLLGLLRGLPTFFRQQRFLCLMTMSDLLLGLLHALLDLLFLFAQVAQ